MTAVLFIVVLAGVYLARTNGLVFVSPGIDVYQVAYFITLLSASFFALRTMKKRFVGAATILIANFAISQHIWTTQNPEFWTAILDLSCTLWFFFLGRYRWEFVISVLFSTSVLVGYITYLELIPSSLTRDSSAIIAAAHPDIIAILGHGASICLGAGAGDGGKSIGRYLRTVPLAFNWRDRMASYLIRV